MAQKQKINPMDEKIIVPSAEELEQERTALIEAKQEEVRVSVISEFGFDEDLDTDKIDKAVEKELDSRKKLSEAIGQKIKHRKEAEELRAKVATPPTPEVKTDPDEVGKMVDSKIKETLDQTKLDELDYPDELKSEIKRIAQFVGGVKQAIKDPYIASKIEAYEKEEKIDEATIGRTHKSGSSAEFDINKPPEFDPSTPETIAASDKAMAEWEKEAKKREKGA